jgi:hypothetical protein
MSGAMRRTLYIRFVTAVSPPDRERAQFKAKDHPVMPASEKVGCHRDREASD